MFKMFAQLFTMLTLGFQGLTHFMQAFCNVGETVEDMSDSYLKEQRVTNAKALRDLTTVSAA